MKKHILTIISLIFIALAFSAKVDVSSFVNVTDIEESYIFDG